MLRRWIAKLALAGFLVGSLSLAALGSQQTVWYGQQTVTSPGLNAQNRYDRIAFGTWMMSALGLTSAGQGVYSNLTTAPGVGLYVTTAPTLSGSNGAVYQVEENDPNPLPSSCPAAVTICPQVSPDPTLIGVAAFQSSTSNPFGPLTPPVTSGEAVYYLLEAQVSPGNDGTLTPEQFIIQALGIYSPQTFSVNVARSDTLDYQTKAGTAATANCSSTFPAEPAVDSGWVAIAYICVPNGASSISSGWISVATEFTGFSTGAGSGTVTNVATGNGIAGGPITTTGTLALASIANGDVLSNISGSSGVPSPNPMSSVLDSVFGSTTGDILYRGSSGWHVLAPGTTGQMLAQGSSGPQWTATPSPAPTGGGGGVGYPCTLQQAYLNTCTASPMPAGYATPVADYPMDDPSGSTTLADVVGGNNATIHGTPSDNYAFQYPLGLRDSSTGFLTDGSGGYASASAGATITGSFSVAMVVRPCSANAEAVGANYGGFWVPGGSGTGVEFYSYDSGGSQGIGVSYGSGSGLTNLLIDPGSNGFQYCKPYFLVFSYDATGGSGEHNLCTTEEAPCFVAWVNSVPVYQVNGTTVTPTTEVGIGGSPTGLGLSQGTWGHLAEWNIVLDGTFVKPLTTAAGT